MKIYLDQNSVETQGAYGFPFKVQAQTVDRFMIKPRSNKSIPVLGNGKYNLEEYFMTSGPMNSIQQVTLQRGRLRFVSRSFWMKTLANTKPEYLYVQWIVNLYFFGYDKNTFYLFDFTKLSSSQVSYTQEIKAVTSSCCSSTISFYALHYNPKLVNSLSVRLLDIIPNYKNTRKTVLQTYKIKYIDSRMIPNIQIPSSKQFLKSVADRTLALCIHDKSMIKILILDYIDKNNPFVTPMRDITTRTVGRRAKFMKVAIISMMTKIQSLRTLAVVIGTKSHLIAEYLNYDPSVKHPKLSTDLVNTPNVPTILTLNGSLDYIICSDAKTLKIGGFSTNLMINSRCVIILNGYLMRSLNFSSSANTYAPLDSESMLYSLSKAEFSEINEYEIPRFYETISVQESPDYLAVHVINNHDNHQEILVYKQRRRQVWVSVYASAEMATTYSLGKWFDGTTWDFVNEIGSELKVYLIGNMTLKVLQGFNSIGKLQILYATFGRPSEVENYTLGFKFSENLVRKNNILLVVYGSIGGFFGVVVIIWCCYCWIFRCVYLCLKRMFEKKERKMIPVLMKKNKKKAD